MAGLIDPNDIAKARQSGYSDQEISKFLSDKHPDQFKTARDAGYSDTEILAHLAPEKAEPSGAFAGLQHGVAEAIRGPASTVGLTGMKTPTMDAAADAIDPKNYKAASVIREGGHWFNPLDYQPSALPQVLAEQAPGLGADMAVGIGAGKMAPGGVVGKGLAGMAGFAGSALLRNFGPGAHANADARTGTPNSPVETTDLTREAAKQAVLAPLNMVGASRLLPTSKIAGAALSKYLKTVGVEAAVGAGSDVVDQAATTAGSKDGLNVDLNRTASTALTRAVGSGVLAAPKLASEASNNRKFGGIEADPDQQLAAQALAKRQLGIADGRKLVGLLGGTKVAAEAVNGAHTDVHSELATASKAENLSQDNANTLSRINSGGKVSETEVKALADEAAPETMHLARQAMVSKQLRDSGNISDTGFTGGVSGAMDNLPLVKHPFKTAAGAALASVAGHAVLPMLGSVAAPALATLGGAYTLAHAFDKMSGNRSPAKGFTDRFGGTDAPVRLPTAAEPVDSFNPSEGPWGARVSAGPTGPSVDVPQPSQPSLRNTLNANVKIEEGMAKIAKRLADDKKKSMISEALPALQQLANRAKTEAQPSLRNTLNANVKIEEGMAKIANTISDDRRKAALAQQQAEGVSHANSVAEESHAINEQGGLEALSNPAFAKRGAQLLSAANVMRKLTAQPGEAEAPAAPSAPTAPSVPTMSETLKSTKAMIKNREWLERVKRNSAQSEPAVDVAPAGTPASPGISALMQKLQGEPAAAPGPVPAVAPTEAPAPTPPVSPLMAKISKKSGKPVEETAHYIPLDPEQLWGRGMQDEKFAQHEAPRMTDLKYPERYMDGVIRDRQKRRGITVDLLGDNPSDHDQNHAANLLEELHHTRRADKAAGAIEHFTAHMSPSLKAAFRKRMDKRFINSMWTK